MIAKPSDIFDREREWEALTEFVTSGESYMTLGMVSGRRRQGKTFLLQALCEMTGGFYFAADQATEAESLRHFSAAMAEFTCSPLPVGFVDWRAAVEGLLAVTTDRELPVVIDEFPNLLKATPTLPSIIQAALAPLRGARLRSRGRLLLCGSALPSMGSLLSGDAPLHGRAGLELAVPPFDYRTAAEFWGIDDPRLAVRVHAIAGGTPAYRREYVDDDSPSGPGDFDDWVCRTVLDPSRPLLREARYLLAEEPGLRDPGLYHSVLSAVAHGNSTSGGIAAHVGRKASDVAHPLSVLEECGLLRREPDLFHGNRMRYRIGEPLVDFYQTILRPDWARWERGRETGRLWRLRRARFDDGVVVPHFAQICRDWATAYAPPEVLGGYPTGVGSGVVNDPANRTAHEVDVVVCGDGADGAEVLLAIGSVAWDDVISTSHLDRLRHIRGLLSTRFDTGRTRMICCSGTGFDPVVQKQAATTDDVVLIGVEDLYAQ